MAFYDTYGTGGYGHGYGGMGGGFGGDYPYESGYDLGGVYHNDLGYDDGSYGLGGGAYDFDNFDIPYYSDAYDRDLYGSYYGMEDDYYGAYGDLMEYEEQLRLEQDITEDERLRRWQERMAFEELAEDERSRRYEMMADEDRMRLGLAGSSWWGGRYGRHSPMGSWRTRYGGRLGAWGGSRMPLSSGLQNRFGRIWGSGRYGGGRVGRYSAGAVGGGGMNRLYAMEQRLQYARDRAQMRAISEQERLRMHAEAERLRMEVERLRRQERMEDQRMRTQMRQDEMYRQREMHDDMRYMHEEDRLRRQINSLGGGIY